jgi:ParB family chromosome partitioning protein
MRLDASGTRCGKQKQSVEVMPMQKESTNKQPNTMDTPLNGQKGEATEVIEIVQQIPLEKLYPFKNHPFKVLDDDAMQQSVESIRQYGVMAPLIARPREGGGYEIISGHRRKYAAELAGLKTLPVIVRPMDDNAAVILMVDSNLQREGLLPSERAFAYKMKMDAIKHQGKRRDTTSRQVVGKFETADILGEATNESGRQVHRYVRLTYLIPELLEMVDQKKIAFNPAVELSYLTEAEQKDFMETMGDCQNAPSLSQAQRIKKLSREGQCTYDAMFAIMGEAKKDELDKVTISNDVLRQYFPRSYTPRQMQDTIIKLLQQWQRKRQREQNR